MFASRAFLLSFALLLSTGACGSRTSLSELGSGAASGAAAGSGAASSAVAGSGAASGAAAGSGGGSTSSAGAASGATASGESTGSTASCVISASNYNQSCNVSSDCVGVNPGNYCGSTRQCFCGPTATINRNALAQFNADVAATPSAMSGAFTPCGCPPGPAVPICCSLGACQQGLPCVPPTLSCKNSCNPGDTRCDSGGISTCVLGPNGCWSYGPIAPCGPHQGCVSVPGGAACKCNADPACVAPGTGCSAGAVVACGVDAQGCLYEYKSMMCPSGVCLNGMCAPASGCNPVPLGPSMCPAADASVGSSMCSAACVAPGAAGTCSQACYVVSANPTPPSMLFGIPNNELQPQYAVDGNIKTRYASGAVQNGSEWFQIELCQPQWVFFVTVRNDSDPLDVSQAYTVQVSMDGSCWTTVAGSSCPAPVDLTVTFPPVQARFVRYTNTAPSPPSGGAHWWAIDEISVGCFVGLR